jgi:hypothetical protein
MKAFEFLTLLYKSTYQIFKYRIFELPSHTIGLSRSSDKLVQVHASVIPPPSAQM